MENHLIDLDFAPGIRASDINKNFTLIHDWLMRERLRSGGWGLVEGFDLQADVSNFRIIVGDGIMINNEGEEVHVPGEVFSLNEMDTTSIVDALVVDEEGYLELTQRPYSAKRKGYIVFDPPAPEKSTPISSDELKITDKISNEEITIVQVVGKKIYVNADAYKGHEVLVEYKTTDNRIDSIMLCKDGTYKYEKSIISTSPSHVDLSKYDDCFVIGVVYWNIDETIDVQFFDDHRTYRKVYVDKQNRLYLNGKLYKEAQIIYMTKPEDPQVNDLWYDHETNTLMIWRESKGEFGWVEVNDSSTAPMRERKMFTGKTFPADAQTFLFADDEVNLRYIPDTNALEVIIDNAVLMDDQFEEVVMPQSKTYLADGIGFKLKNPLDRETPVEVIVHHAVKSKPLRETFQRAAIFIAENNEYFNVLNTAQVFETVNEYVIGQDQLEVFLDGRRLSKNIDYVEMVNATTKATPADRNKMTKNFAVLKKLSGGELVTHKISKHVWSFDQLDMMMHEIEDKANKGLQECAQLRIDISNLNDNTIKQIQALIKNIDAIRQDFGDPKSYLKKTDPIDEKAIPQGIKDKLCGAQIDVTLAATEPILLTDTKPSDFFIVNYISQTMNRALIRGVEYDVVAAGKDTQIILKPDFSISGANVYICGMRIGA